MEVDLEVDLPNQGMSNMDENAFEPVENAVQDFFPNTHFWETRKHTC